MMKVKDLIRELETYPDDWDVAIDVKGERAAATDVDMEGWNGAMYLIIHDFPVAPNG